MIAFCGFMPTRCQFLLFLLAGCCFTEESLALIGKFIQLKHHSIGQAIHPYEVERGSCSPTIFMSLTTSSGAPSSFELGTCNVTEKEYTKNNHNSFRDDNGGKLGNRHTVINLRAYEEKEKREMEWLVHTTSKILPIGIDKHDNRSDREPPGHLSEVFTHKAFLLMKAWSRRGDYPHVVELILRRLLEERDAGNPHVELSTKTFDIVLDAWSKSNDSCAAERAEAILNEMEQQCYTGGNKKVRPTVNSYNAVIKAYIKNKKLRQKSYQKAQDLIARMRSAYPEDRTPEESKQFPVSPNRRSYNLLLYAIANSSLEDAGEKAEAILSDMLVRYKSGDKSVKPDINSYNQVIGAWSHGHVNGYERRMQQVFDQLIDLPHDFDVNPNVDTFNHVLGGWLKSKDINALQHIHQTLDVMEMSFQNGNEAAKPDRVTINTLIAAHGLRGVNAAPDTVLQLGERLERKYDIQPDTACYNILVESWRNSGRKDALLMIEDILNTMESDFKNGKTMRKPDAYTYSSVIDTYAKCGGDAAAIKAQKVLMRMRDLFHNHGGDPANTHIYNAAINAWASSGSKHAASRAYAILKEMEDNHGVDPFVPAPNLISVNTVIKAFCGSSEGAELAEELLTKLEEAESYSGLEPDVYSFTAVISAYGRSEIEDKAERAFKVLERMIQSYQNGNSEARPNIHTFNAALNACAFVSGDSERQLAAFFILVKIMMLLNQYAKSDHITYGTILRASSALLPPGDLRREELVESVFRTACRKGQVGQMVLKQMKFAPSAELYQKLLERNIGDRIHIHDLPVSWTRNVRERRRKIIR